MHRLTQKQFTFCLQYVKTGKERDSAITAGYSPKTAHVIASENLTKPKIIDYIQALRQKTEDASIANVVERKQRLTVIMREDNFGKFGINRTSNISAADLLNKMDKIYTDGPTVNIDNRDLTINVLTPKARKQVEKLIEGERTE